MSNPWWIEKYQILLLIIISLMVIYTFNLCVYVYAWLYMYMYVCICVYLIKRKAQNFEHLNINTIYIFNDYRLINILITSNLTNIILINTISIYNFLLLLHIIMNFLNVIDYLKYISKHEIAKAHIMNISETHYQMAFQKLGKNSHWINSVLKCLHQHWVLEK